MHGMVAGTINHTLALVFPSVSAQFSQYFHHGWSAHTSPSARRFARACLLAYRAAGLTIPRRLHLNGIGLAGFGFQM